MLQPRLRPGVGAGVDSAGLLRLVFFTESRHVLFDAQPPVLDTIRLLDQALPREVLLQRVSAEHSDFREADLDEILDALLAEGAIEDAAKVPDVLSVEDTARFRRQIDLFYDLAEGDQHPVQLQQNLRRATVTVVGVGGTGTWMAQSLALVGVGTLILVDPDTVEVSNLSRQVLYCAADVGRHKIDAAAERLREKIGPGITVRGFRQRLDGAPLDRMFAGSDLVINCADEPDTNTTSAWISDACMRRRIPHIVGGGYAGHVGLIGPTIIPFQTACWTCFARDAERRNDGETITPLIAHRRRHTAAFAPLSAIVSNLQVWDAVRVLSGLGAPVLANRLGELDLRTAHIDWRAVPRDPDCPTCGGTPG